MSAADDKEREALTSAYMDLSHALQSGVLWEQSNGSQDGTPKHLRVGVNMALCHAAALTRLLVEKGVFTELDALRAQVDELRRELDRYHQRNPGLRFS